MAADVATAEVLVLAGAVAGEVASTAGAGETAEVAGACETGVRDDESCVGA